MTPQKFSKSASWQRFNHLVILLIPPHARYWMLLGLGIRLLLAPFLQFTYDPVVWYATGNSMLAGLGPYGMTSYPYPPLWAMSYYPFLFVASLFTDPATFGARFHEFDSSSIQVGFYSSIILSPTFLFIVKLPLILADLLTGGLIHWKVQAFSTLKAAKLAYIVWLLNPVVIWTSAVHGMYDVLPGLFCLLSLLFLSKMRYVQSGVSLSIAILYKLFPVYLLPFYLILIWTSMGRHPTILGMLRERVLKILKFSLGLIIPAAVILPFVSTSDLLHPLDVRFQYLIGPGGLSPWGFTEFPVIGPITYNFASANISIIQLVTSAIIFALSLFLAILLVRNGPVRFPDLARVGCLIIVASCFALFTVNPQYVLWFLPLLTIVVYTKKVYKLQLIGISSTGFLYQLGLVTSLILGPLAYLGLGHSWADLLGSHSVFNAAPAIIIGLLGALVLVSIPLARMKVHLSTANKNDSLTVAASKSKRGLSMSTILLAVFLGYLVFSGALMSRSPTARIEPVALNSQVGAGTITVQSTFQVTSSNFPLHLRFLASPISSVNQDETVYVYYDPMYPTLGNDLRGWIGIVDHLGPQLQFRGYNAPIRLIDARQLRDIMTQNIRSVVVIPSGVFPNTVHGTNSSLVHSWLSSGGTLVWMGARIGTYSGYPGTAQTPKLVYLGQNGTRSVLGSRLIISDINGTQTTARQETVFSSALTLAYPDVVSAPSIASLRLVGGMPLGLVQNASDNSRVSVSLIPVGSGKVILFGGPVTSALTPDGEDVVSRDAAQILMLGNIVSAESTQYSSYTISARTSTSIKFTASLNVTSARPAGVVVAGFSMYDYSTVYWRSQLPAM